MENLNLVVNMNHIEDVQNLDLVDVANHLVTINIAVIIIMNTMIVLVLAMPLTINYLNKSLFDLERGQPSIFRLKLDCGVSWQV